MLKCRDIFAFPKGKYFLFLNAAYCLCKKLQKFQILLASPQGLLWELLSVLQYIAMRSCVLWKGAFLIHLSHRSHRSILTFSFTFFICFNSILFLHCLPFYQSSFLYECDLDDSQFTISRTITVGVDKELAISAVNWLQSWELWN